MSRLLKSLWVVLALVVVALPQVAQAAVVAKVDISSQRMNVYIDGELAYSWAISWASPGLLVHARGGHPADSAEADALLAQIRQLADAAFDFLPRRLRDPRHRVCEAARPPRKPRLHPAASEQRGDAVLARENLPAPATPVSSYRIERLAPPTCPKHRSGRTGSALPSTGLSPFLDASRHPSRPLPGQALLENAFDGPRKPRGPQSLCAAASSGVCHPAIGNRRGCVRLGYRLWIERL